MEFTVLKQILRLHMKYYILFIESYSNLRLEFTFFILNNYSKKNYKLNKKFTHGRKVKYHQKYNSNHGFLSPSTTTLTFLSPSTTTSRHQKRGLRSLTKLTKANNAINLPEKKDQFNIYV